jgi:hypothetical protein
MGSNGYGVVTQSFWDTQSSGQGESAGGTGLTTPQMQDIQTYLDAGWDWVGEMENGTHEVWQMAEGDGCPVLAAFHGYRAPHLKGSGTADDPYLISNAEELGAMIHYNAQDHYRLTASIDLSGIRWGMAVIPQFAGTFDGSGHTISHLRIQGGSHLGLFGRLDSRAEVKILGVVDVNITGSGGCIGGLVGANGGTVTQCYSAGAVSGTGYAVGGLAGHNGGTVVQCYSNAAVSGVDAVGGLVGDNDGGVAYCYSSGAVRSTGSAGGLAGDTASMMRVFVVASFWDILTSGQATSCGGTGKTTTEMQTAKTFLDAGWDFVGEIENGIHEIWQMPPGGGYPILAILSGYTPPQLQGRGTPEDPFLISDALELGTMWRYSPYAHYRLAADIDLSGVRWSTAVIPSLAGTFDGDGHTILHLTIKKMEARGYAGLFGYLRSGAEVKNLGVVDVNIAGRGIFNYVGGVVGSNGSWDTSGGNVTRCYSTGAVRGTGLGGWVGGLVGENHGNVTNCYSTAAVRVPSQDWGSPSGWLGSGGGLVGYNGGGVTQCYSAGVVSGTGSYVAGLVGYNNDTTHATVTACFWDTQTSGQTESAGGTGKATAEMLTASTFLDAGWDFVGETANGTEDLWWIDEGKDYPHLWWEAQN